MWHAARPRRRGHCVPRLRKRALDGEAKKAAWFEFSVPEIGDVKDPARWAATNPALGRRIQFSTIEAKPNSWTGHLCAGAAGLVEP